MRRNSFICILISMVFMTSSLIAQPVQEFSEEPAEFLKELHKHITSTKRQSSQAVADKFKETYELGSIGASELASIMETSNLLLERRTNVYPYWEMYFGAINSFYAAETKWTTFGKWAEITHQVTENQKRGSNTKLKAYLEFSTSLFDNGFIFHSSARTWGTTARSCTFKYTDQPEIDFPQGNIFAHATGDTMTIFNSSGTYFPLESEWKGNEGKVQWTRAGFNTNEVYCEFKEYDLDVKKSIYSVDSVQFYFTLFFDKPMEGKLENKLVTGNKKETSTYPRFYSYTEIIEIPDLGEGVDYVGGFTLRGSKIVGQGTPENPARLTFHHANGQKALLAKSTEILIRKPVEINAIDCEVSVYIGKDSIYHPSLKLNYRIPERELMLLRGQEGIAKVNFFDSYHKQEITADIVRWNLNEPSIDIDMITQAGVDPAIFTSSNYFRSGELDKFQGINDFNPVDQLKRYVERTGSKEFYADGFAQFLHPNYREHSIKRLLYRLVEDGFINYVEELSFIRVKPKLFRYILAGEDKIDYDVIRIQSYTRDINGKIDIESNLIDLEGVSKVTVSDSQSVNFEPDSFQLQLERDRDMRFSGKVEAGRLDFIGKGFHFEYDSFMVDLTDLAAAVMYVPSGEIDNEGYELLKPLQSKIEGLTGTLLIDKPDNKSSKEHYPEYPIYKNTQESYVYYDKEGTFDSVYNREDFYFELEPFEFDSLDNFNPYMSDFQGDFHSGDIFPVFSEDLTIQEDLSFGFERTTPPEGFPIYGGKGTFTDSIFLSNKGLRGKGKVDYMFVDFDAKDIIFFPDSMNAKTENFHMDKTFQNGVGFPLVDGTKNLIHWLPYSDSMFIKMTSDPFSMYEINASLEGDLVLSPNGLFGNGEFTWKEAQMISKQFAFEADALEADTMSLEILAIDRDKVTFITPNVKGRVDFEARKGTFKSNVSGIPTEFANNQYKTNIDEFFWDMELNVLEFRTPPGSGGEYFVSTHADQDSLKFKARTAFFDLPTSVITAEGVDEIPVADGLVVPDSGKVVILAAAQLETLENATIK